jgi:hypothetical protein
VLGRIIRPKRDEVTGEWRMLHNVQLHNLSLSLNIIRQIKSRRMRSAGHVARTGNEPSGSVATESVKRSKTPVKRKPSFKTAPSSPRHSLCPQTITSTEMHLYIRDGVRGLQLIARYLSHFKKSQTLN